MRDYLGLSDDRLSHGLLVGFLCLIFSLPAFSALSYKGLIQWETHSNGQSYLVRRSSIDGTLLQLLDATSGSSGSSGPSPSWTFPDNGAGGVDPISPAPALDIPVVFPGGGSATVAVQGISEATAVDAADLGASAAPDILAIAGKALPLVGSALALWQLYGVIENSSGSGYSSSSSPSYPPAASSVPSGCTVVYDNTSPAPWVPQAAVSGNPQGTTYGQYGYYIEGYYSGNGSSELLYAVECGTVSEANQGISNVNSSIPSLQSWTAAQSARTIGSDIANYLGSNPSQATNLANDLASQPGGTPLSTPTPINYSGPSTATGNPQTVTTTNPDGSTNTQTVTPTVNITYGPDVSVTNDTTTKNYYCGSGASPSTASVGSAPAPVSSTNSTGTCAVTSATTSGLVIPDSAVAPTESFPSAPTVSVVDNVLAFNPTVTSNGQCPANNTFVLFGTTYNISWQPICGFASDIYPFVTASGAILAGVLIFR